MTNLPTESHSPTGGSGLTDQHAPNTAHKAASGATMYPALSRGRSAAELTIAALILFAWLAIASVVHLTQGTAEVGLSEIWSMLMGNDVGQQALVIAQSRLPRLGAALVVGICLGAAGAAMQSVTRNPLASPDTTAVNAGAYLFLTVTAGFGLSFGPLPSTAIAFLGGILAAALVLSVSGGGGQSSVRLVLAGSVIVLGLHAITSVVLLLLPWETQGLFAWGAGSLSQHSSDAIISVVPIMVVALIVLMTQGRRLDILQLGDDSARSLGVPIASTRTITIICSVLLAAASVTVAGPIGFVGLCAPLVIRLLSSWLRPLRKQVPFILASSVGGVALVLSADVVVRAVFGPTSGVSVPTGVVTSVIGAVALIVLARRLTALGSDGGLATMKAGSAFARRYPWVLLVTGIALLVAAVALGVLVGDQKVLLGDFVNWLKGVASIRLEIIFDTRVPRVTAALLAGAALAISGAIMQTFTRNPLADPGILGVSNSAGLGAVITLIVLGSTSFTTLFAGALAGAIVSAIVIFGLSSRGGLNTMRLILVGVGMATGASAVTTLLLVQTDPWNQSKAITWLGGSTFGTTFNQQLILLVVLIVVGFVLSRTARDLDIVALDELTPQVLGIALNKSKFLHISIAIVLAALATATVGVIAFVGLVAPHAARMLIGKNHRWFLPMAATVGALLVVVADAIGRSVIAPAQIPAGISTAVIGAPYFIWLLWRARDKR